MTIREHLKKVHERSAEDHVRFAKAHSRMAKHYSGVEDAGDLADAHEELAATHTAAGEFHIQCCKALTKIADDDLGKASGFGFPQGISSIIPPAPESESRLHAVPRMGAPSLDLDKVQVAPGFEHLVKID